MTAPTLPRSNAETLLAVQLEQAGIPFEREYRFAPPRRWRADYLIPAQDNDLGNGMREFIPALLVEIDGGGFIAGRHSRGTGVEADAEKQSAAAILGYRVIRATPRQVEDGRCLEWIRQALGYEGPILLSWRALKEQNKSSGLVPLVIKEVKAQGRRLP